MAFGNGVVSTVLRSPLHRLLSGSNALVRYRGRRSDDPHELPVQYAVAGDELVIIVGKAQNKTWWRNFITDHPLRVRVRGTWRDLIGRVVIGADEPEEAKPLVAAYVERFPRAIGLLGGGHLEDLVDNAVIVRCRAE